MNGSCLQRAILRAASLVAPSDQRAEWLEGWHSELWYLPRRGATRFCLGAFRDAAWLRRNSPEQPNRLESPLRCLALLGAVAAGSFLVSLQLTVPGMWRRHAHLTAADVAIDCVGMLLITAVLLPLAWIASGRAPASGHPLSWPSRLRNGVFLALKIVLVQPFMLCGFFLLLWIGPVVPMAPQLAAFASWILALRWALADQRQRCPVCLRRLSGPVRIGTPSETFLEWYGAESMCARGHGLLHAPEIFASYSGPRQWLRLDGSWSSLFSDAAGARRP